MKRIKCPRKECGYVWSYKGKAKFVTSCPKCKTSVSIKKNEVKK